VELVYPLARIGQQLLKSPQGPLSLLGAYFGLGNGGVLYRDNNRLLRRTLHALEHSPWDAPQGCILTKLDETTCLGGALAVAIEQGLPIAYATDGQRVPEDLHAARPYSLVSRGVAIMKQTGETINEDLVALAFGKEVANAGF